MRRTFLTVIGIILFSGAIAHANQPVGIPQNTKVISERAQKAAVSRYLNRLEGRKLSFAQRKGTLGGFTTVGGTARTWSVTGPAIPIPLNAAESPSALIWPISGSHAGEIEINKNHPRGVPRVTIYPEIMANQ